MERIEDYQQDSWSVSALKAIGTCGAQYAYRYHTPREDAEVTAPLAFGSAIHKCIERLQKEGGKLWEPEHWQEMWSDEWYEYSVQVDWSHSRKAQFDKLGAEILATYIKQPQLGELLESEYGFGAAHHGQDIYTIGEYMIKGVIDQIWRRADGRLVVVDLKTSKQKPDPLMLRADPQFTLYWQAVRTKYKEEPLMAWRHLRTGELLYTTRTVADLEVAHAMLAEAQVKVDRKMFARNIGYHCGFCPYMKVCLGALDV